MKQLIDGVVFDTEKSLLIGDIGGHWIETFDGGSLYIQKQLYKTKSGRFFIASCCPPAPGFFGKFVTGGYRSGWILSSISKKTAQEMVWKNKWDFKTAGLKEPATA